MDESVVVAIKRSLRERGLADPSEIRGCTAVAISLLEQAYGLRFPEAYREFLAEMGRSAGELFRGSDAFYDKLVHLRGWAMEMIEESASGFELPGDAVVFLMHQGYVLFFFRTSEGDDPPVYRLRETEKAATRVNDAFSSFLTSTVAACAEMCRVHEGFRKKHGLDSK
jgi:hypothetical protein